MTHQTLHVYSKRRAQEIHTLAIFLPIIVFVLMLTFFFTKLPKNQVAQSESQPAVLGGESQIR